ncbi:hypothetical protein GQX74_009109 [Glossina fuscipes]|nr:hypothetical protein GQX74_009109 [Glossina fuscipes]
MNAYKCMTSLTSEYIDKWANNKEENSGSNVWLSLNSLLYILFALLYKAALHADLLYKMAQVKTVLDYHIPFLTCLALPEDCLLFVVLGKRITSSDSNTLLSNIFRSNKVILCVHIHIQATICNVDN